MDSSQTAVGSRDLKVLAGEDQNRLMVAAVNSTDWYHFDHGSSMHVAAAAADSIG